MSDKKGKDWTIMIYLAGDNNLSVEMSYAIEQMRTITAANDKINLFAYFDGYSNNIPTLYADFSDPKSTQNFYRSHEIIDKLFPSDKNDNENSASMYNIMNFVDWCVNKVEHYDGDKVCHGRQATNYAMIFSGHSMGFQTIGLFRDSKSNYGMSLPRLRWAFQRLIADKETLVKWADADRIKAQKMDRKWSEEYYKQKTTPVIGQPLALLGFDSCVMSMLEIASQFSGIAETMVGSEGNIPNAGWSYAQMLLGELYSSKGTVKDIARSFVEKFIVQQSRFALASVSVDMAAWDLAKVGEVEASFNDFAKALIGCFQVENDSNFGQMKRVLLQARAQCQTYMMEQNVDLVDLCQFLVKEIDLLEAERGAEGIDRVLTVRAKANDVIKKAKACILLTGFSGGQFQYSNGISLYFPWTREGYCASSWDYKKLDFIRKAGAEWKIFLEKYLGQITFRQAKQLTPTNKNGSFVLTPNASSVVFQSYYYGKDPGRKSNDCINTGSGDSGNGTKHWPDDPVNKGADGAGNGGSTGTKHWPDDPVNKGEGGDGGGGTGTKHWPDDPLNKGVGEFARGISSVMGQFLDSYGKIKNVESPWNIAGFGAEGTAFVAEGQTSSTSRPTVHIPGSIRIQDLGNEILQKLSEADRNVLAPLLRSADELGDDPAFLELLYRLDDSIDERLSNPPIDIHDAILKSIDSVRDEEFKAKVRQRFI